MRHRLELPGRRSLSDAEAEKRATLRAELAALAPTGLTPRERAAIALRVQSGRIAQSQAVWRAPARGSGS